MRRPVVHVGASCVPAQIAQAIVPGVPVIVAALLALGTRPPERF